MKKVLLLVLLMVVFLVGCSTTLPEVAEDNPTEVSEDNTVEDDTNKVNETEAGFFTLIKQVEPHETYNSGCMELTISKVNLIHVKTKEEARYLFDDKEEVLYVAITMAASNTTEDTICFYPDQLVLTTNTGEQIDADMFLSDSVGGDFYGKVTKEGDVVALLNKLDQDIEWVKLIIRGAFNEDFERVGEDLAITINF